MLISWYCYTLWYDCSKKLSEITEQLDKVQTVHADQESYKSIFNFATSEQAQKIFLNTKRSAFPKIFNQLAKASNLDHLTYTIQNTSHMDGILDKTTQKSQINLLCESKDDRSIFLFIDNLKNKFPGFVLIESILIEKVLNKSKKIDSINAKISLFIVTKSEV